MIRLALIFPVLCFVLFGAHLLFHGWGLEIALLPLIPVVLLFVRHRYCAVICGMLLVCAGFEWLYTAIDLALTRQAYGMPWVRATVIIGTCAAVTWLAGAMLFWLNLTISTTECDELEKERWQKQETASRNNFLDAVALKSVRWSYFLEPSVAKTLLSASSTMPAKAFLLFSTKLNLPSL